MSKFLDNTGLATLWANIKTLLSTSLSDFGKKVILSTEKGTANGVAELDESGKVPASQLPSYVDDVLEYASITAFPATGETGKIYVSLSDNKTYRWSGSAYVEIASGVTLGETSSTAYRGDRGKIAYDHSQKTHAPTTPATASAAGLMSATDKQKLDSLQNYTHPAHTAKTSGLYKITVDAQGHVSAATAVAKSDITALGIPAQDTTYSAATTSKAGLMSATDKQKLDSLQNYTHPAHTAKTSGLYKITVDAQGHVSAATAVAKSDITALGIPAQDTTYSAATASKAGLMSAADKQKLEGLQNYNHPAHTAKASGLYKITVDAQGHVSAATAVAKSDITALGIPAQDTTYSAATASKAGLMSAEDKSKLDNISNHINPYASLSTKKLTLPLPYLFDAQTGNLMQGKYSGFEFTTFLDAINDVDINQEQLLFKALTTSDAYNARFYISIVPEKSSLKIWDSKSQEIYAYINNAGMFSVGPESNNGHISLQVRNGGAVYFQHTLTQYVCIKGFMTFRVLIDDNLNN